MLSPCSRRVQGREPARPRQPADRGWRGLPASAERGAAGPSSAPDIGARSRTATAWSRALAQGVRQRSADPACPVDAAAGAAAASVDVARRSTGRSPLPRPRRDVRTARCSCASVQWSGRSSVLCVLLARRVPSSWRARGPALAHTSLVSSTRARAPSSPVRSTSSPWCSTSRCRPGAAQVVVTGPDGADVAARARPGSPARR